MKIVYRVIACKLRFSVDLVCVYFISSYRMHFFVILMIFT